MKEIFKIVNVVFFIAAWIFAAYFWGMVAGQKNASKLVHYYENVYRTNDTVTIFHDIYMTNTVTVTNYTIDVVMVITQQIASVEEPVGAYMPLTVITNANNMQVIYKAGDIVDDGTNMPPPWIDPAHWWCHVNYR